MSQLNLKAIPAPVFGIGTAIFFGISTPLTKLLLTNVDPWMLAGLLFLSGGVGLLPIYLLRNQLHPPARSLEGKDWLWLGASVLAGGVIAPVLLTLGLTITPATVASLLLNFEGVFTALLAWTIFRETWRWQVFAGIIAITAGGILLSQSNYSQAGLSWGTIAILGTCLGWAMDSNFTNKVAGKDALQLAMLKSGGAGLINVAIALALGQTFPAFPILLPIFGVGFMASGLTLVCFILALRRLGSARTGAYFALAPFAGASLAILLLGESITQSLVAATLLMLLGTGLCITEKS